MSARKLANAKRIQEKKQKRLQRLKTKQAGSPFGSSRLHDGPFGLESMSDVLRSFISEVQDTNDGYAISVVSTLPLPLAP